MLENWETFLQTSVSPFQTLFLLHIRHTKVLGPTDHCHGERENTGGLAPLGHVPERISTVGRERLSWKPSLCREFPGGWVMAPQRCPCPDAQSPYMCAPPRRKTAD